MFKRFLIAAAIALGVASPVTVLAADIGSWKDSAVSHIADPDRAPFAGLYLGAFVQWDVLGIDADGKLDPAGPHNRRDVNSNLDADGIAGGLEVSRQWQIGRVYFGPRLRASYGETSAVDGSTDDLEITKTWDAAGDLKVGLALTDQIGIYGFAGYGAAGFKSKADGNEDHSETLHGAVYGLGTDLVISDHWTTSLEYQRFDPTSFKADGSVLQNYSADPTIDTVRMTVNYRW